MTNHCDSQMGVGYGNEAVTYAHVVFRVVELMAEVCRQWSAPSAT
jgi:hypothetical protein